MVTCQLLVGLRDTPAMCLVPHFSTVKPLPHRGVGCTCCVFIQGAFTERLLHARFIKLYLQSRIRP